MLKQSLALFYLLQRCILIKDLKLIGIAFALSFVASGAAADTINSYDSGWYRDDGYRIPGRTNITDQPSYNNFFVYDLSAVSGTVTGATLTIFGENGTYFNSDDSVTYNIYDVTTSVTSLVGGTGGVSAYTDLQSGTIYGSTTIATIQNERTPMPTVTINLTEAALSDLSSSLGGLFAVGGNSDVSNYLWANSDTSNPATSMLTLEVSQVPIPAAAWLFGSALLGLGVIKRRKA